MSAAKKAEVAIVEQAQAPVSINESASLLGLIERAAKDPSVDIDKMERLFQMHERVTARAAEAAFNTAMAKVQAELKPVARNLRNKQTSSNYADLAAISDAADPVIHKHGFGIICSEFRSELEGHLGIQCEVTHSDGHSRPYRFNIPVDGAGLKGNANKTPTHAYASTITYGRRYAKCSVFDIATKDDKDGNAERQPENDTPITAEQIADLKERLRHAKLEEAKFLTYGKVEKLEDIMASQFDRACTVIANYGRKAMAHG